MSDFGETWRLVRGRFDDAVKGLSADQLNWRLHSDALTIGEMALHVAGVEVSFITQLKGETAEGDLERLKVAATEGVINETGFPFAPDEIDAAKVDWALSVSRKMVEEMIDELTPETRSRTIKSALGPMIDGTGAFARLAYHPGYHQGQVHLVKTAPGFPD